MCLLHTFQLFVCSRHFEDALVIKDHTHSSKYSTGLIDSAIFHLLSQISDNEINEFDSHYEFERTCSIFGGCVARNPSKCQF